MAWRDGLQKLNSIIHPISLNPFLEKVVSTLKSLSSNLSKI